jgi:hypothetical protein
MLNEMPEDCCVVEPEHSTDGRVAVLAFSKVPHYLNAGGNDVMLVCGLQKLNRTYRGAFGSSADFFANFER